ncbi:MAG: hypothetical protein F6K23_18655 [Okeania sp. SIO2C9]|uniref:hypothetical protein n=1 Tax=Okeania sp. SIO2C9 TaxID=2607791 RepID=UPI0013C0613B|nr:hypothetical protein [Okeania sp. SIO2C9]NEQ74883.1 hypothetical protein [Okeania sp. SIO2C9]
MITVAVFINTFAIKISSSYATQDFSLTISGSFLSNLMESIGIGFSVGLLGLFFRLVNIQKVVVGRKKAMIDYYVLNGSQYINRASFFYELEQLIRVC